MAWSAEYVLFCHITSQVEKDPYQKLLTQKGGQGFPYLVFMDADGNVLAKHRGARTVEGFGKTAEEAKAFLDLKAKAGAGDKESQVALFFKQLELKHLSSTEARRCLDEMKDLPAERRQQALDRIVDLEVDEIVANVTQDKKTRIEAGRRFVEMNKAGRIPKTEEYFQAYWILILDYAESVPDSGLFEKALGILREKYGANPQAAAFFRQKEETLRRLRGE